MTESFRSDFIVDENTLIHAISIVYYPVALEKGFGGGQMIGTERRGIRDIRDTLKRFMS